MTPEDQEREQAIRESYAANDDGVPAYDDIPWLLDRLTEERERREALDEQARALLDVIAEHNALRGER